MSDTLKVSDSFPSVALFMAGHNMDESLHVQVSLPPLVVIVTTYEPDPHEWIDGKQRR